MQIGDDRIAKRQNLPISLSPNLEEHKPISESVGRIKAMSLSFICCRNKSSLEATLR